MELNKLNRQRLNLINVTVLYLEIKLKYCEGDDMSFYGVHKEQQQVDFVKLLLMLQ